AAGSCQNAFTGCDGTGACIFSPKAPGTACGSAGLLCDGLSTNCPTSCTADSQCASGRYCAGNGTCQLRIANGSACNTNAGATAATCKVASCRECTSNICSTDTGSGASGNCCTAACSPTAGTCENAATGCDGTGACQFSAKAAGTPCGAAGYLCNGSSTTCPTSCASDSDCVAGDFCDSAAHCTARKTQGSVCN